MTNQDKSGAAKSTETEEKARLERANRYFDEADVMFTDLSGEVYDATEILSGYHSEVRYASIAFAAGFALSELEAANKRLAELEASLSQSMQAIGFVAFTIDLLIHEHLEKAAENAQLLLSTER